MKWSVARVSSVLLNGAIALLVVTAVVGVMRKRSPELAEAPPYSVGDTLPQMWFRVLNEGYVRAAKEVSVDELAGDGCVAFMFYDPYCPGCVNAAPLWSGQDSIVLHDTQIPIAWVGMNRADSSAMRYLNDAGLRGARLMFGPGEQLDWRVYTVPQTYVVTNSRVLVSRGTYHTQESLIAGDVEPAIDRCEGLFAAHDG